MERKNLIIIGVIIAIIAIIGVIFVSGVFNQTQTTPFDTDFMSGTFIGNVSQTETNESYTASFRDSANNITYNITTMDNSSALMEIYRFQGVIGPEHRSYNGNDWDIYFGEAMPVVNNQSNQTSNQSMGIIIAECQKENQGYVIYVIFEDISKVNFTLNTYGEAYVKFIEPLLGTVSLKQSDNVPAIYEEFGLSKEEFDQQIELIHQINSGNYSALS